MSEEQNNGTSPVEGRSTSNRRSNRSGRNRPVLVTGDTTDRVSGDAAQEDGVNGISTQADMNAQMETINRSAQTVSGESTVKKRPGFFSTLGGKKDDVADATAARIARATRNKAATPAKKETKEVQATKKPEPQAAAKNAPARTGGRAAPARRGGFKPRHMIGILLYLVVADVAGVYEKSLLGKADKLLFSLGPLPIYTSTILFLLTLIILLIVLARFDLVPRSLTPRASQPATTGKGPSQQKKDVPDDAGSKATPSMKQGVRGANDDLYQEYRETQRYWQRRDRKK